METKTEIPAETTNYETPDPMRRARRGKIARLPRRFREHINQRLANGESAPTILDWVNEQPEVQDLLDNEFEGNPISDNNLSEWRLGGFKEWEQQQAACERLRALGDCAGQFQDAAEGRLSDHLAQVFALELLDMLEKVLDETTSTKERWACLREGLREIRMLRGADHNAGRLALAEAQWTEKRRQAAEAEEKALRARQERQALSRMMAGAMGVKKAPVPAADEVGELAEFLQWAEKKKALADLPVAPPAPSPTVPNPNGAKIQPENQPKNQGNPTISNQIQPPPKNGHVPPPASRPLTRKEALAQFAAGPPPPPLNIHPAKKSPSASPGQVAH